MNRFFLQLFLTTLVVIYATFVGWIVPNSELILPFDPGSWVDLAVLALGAAAFCILDILLDWLYVAVILLTLGLGCLTLPLWLVCSGGLALYLVGLLGIWQVTLAPLWFLVFGFALSLLGNLARGLTANNS
jgi:hypothetical protein